MDVPTPPFFLDRTDQEDRPVRKTFRWSVEKYAGETTCHGISCVFTHKSYIAKTIWIVILLGRFCIGFYDFRVNPILVLFNPSLLLDRNIKACQEYNPYGRTSTENTLTYHT